MKAILDSRVLAGLLGLALLACGSARAEDVVAPSFKTSTDKETKEFVAKVGTVIVKAARKVPEEIALDRYEYSKPKAGRHELLIKMNFTSKAAKLLKKKYTATIKIKIDSADRDSWEVLSIDYKDDSISLLKPNEAKIRKLVAEFNR
jgi:hypothetical protein